MDFGFSFPLLASILFSLCLYIKILKKKSANKIPPGPWKLPFVGNIHQLVTAQPHRRLTELAKTHGPIMQIQIGQIPAVIISSAKLAKQVLKTDELHFLGRPSLLAVEIIMYNGSGITFAPYGEYWRQMKKIAILEVLTAKRVKSFRSIREQAVANFVDNLRSESGSPVNLTKALSSLMNSIIAISTIGKRCKKEEKLIQNIAAAMAAAGGFSVAEAFPSLFGLLPLISTMKSLLRRIHQQADEIAEEIVNEHKANRAARESKIEAENILDVLLDIQERGDLEFNLTTDHVKALILEILGTATDTSSVTTQWTMSELMNNPGAMKRAQEEVRQVCKGKKTVDEEDLHEMKYLKSIVKETFRLHPPVPLIPRQCIEKSHLNEYSIHPETRVLINTWAIGRDPTIWDKPERFQPERFLNSPIDFKGNDFELLPFGAGKRICPGITMAMANVDLILAQMLFHFDWKTPGGAKSESIDMTESFGIAIRRKTELILVPIPYDP